MENMNNDWMTLNPGDESLQENVEKLRELIEHHDQLDTEIEFHGVKFRVRNKISLEEMIAFVDGVASSCHDTGFEYMPELFEYTFRLMVVRYYTDLPVPQDSSPSYAMMFIEGLFEAILEHVSEDQIKDIRNSIHRKVEYSINTTIKELEREATDIIAKVGGVYEDLSAHLTNLSAKDWSTLIESFAGGGFSEEKLMEAYLKSKEKEEAQDA